MHIDVWPDIQKKETGSGQTGCKARDNPPLLGCTRDKTRSINRSNVKQKAILSSGMVEAESSLENSYPSFQSKDLVLARSTAKNLKRFEVSAKNVEDVAHLSAVDMDGVEWATKTLECFQCFVKAVRHRADVPHFKVESLCNCPNVDLYRQFQRLVYEQLPTQKRLQEP
ncbi:MAG: hypothetical protein BYD32DRAFT_456262 [Podila humilis]|nr:MAG: hypothetical protein BYD32DRAFT_456262 [Podila humilis]